MAWPGMVRQSADYTENTHRISQFRLAYKIKGTLEKKFNLHWEVQQ